MPILELYDGLTRTSHFDREMAALADRHYSRQTHGSPQFIGNGRKLVLRNAEGTVVFGWIWSEFRLDGQTGYNCAIFRNESTRKASEIILEAEDAAFAKWGPNRLYTYIDPTKTKHVKVHGKEVIGFCYLKAGWRDTGKKSKAGAHLFVKYDDSGIMIPTTNLG